MAKKKKQKLTKEQKKMQYARAVSANGSRANPYLPNDPKAGMRNPKRETKPMKAQADVIPVKQWIGTIVVLLIPLVNIIALFAWANKKNGKVNPSKRTFAKAYLWVLLFVLLIGAIVGALIMFVLPLLGIALV